METLYLDEAVELANEIITEKAAYDNNPTKASSKRLRMYLNDIKKVVTSAKQELMELDNKDK